MRNRRAFLLTAALGLLVGAATVSTARAGGCPTCAAGGGHGGAHVAPVSAWGGAPVAGPGYGAFAGAVPNGLSMDIFCGQGSGYCNQRYQHMRRWAEHRYVKKTGATYIPIDPYGARLSMSGPDFAYPEGARVVSGPVSPAPTALPPAPGADPAALPPATP